MDSLNQESPDLSGERQEAMLDSDNPLPPAAALRKAQLALWQKYQDPQL